MRTKAILLLVALGVSGCVSNNSIQAIQVGDTNKSCEVLTLELNQLGVKFEETKDESGFTGKNVGMAILFWPGIFVNESRANRNQSAVQQRVQYLTGLYNSNCIGKKANSYNKDADDEEASDTDN
jgi:hypothetical protein